MSAKTLHIEGNNVTRVVKALSNDIRIRILQMLSDSDMNVQQIAARLTLSKTAVLTHLNILEESGFVKSQYLSGSVGNQRICSCVYEKLVFDFIPGKYDDEGVYYESEIPVGNFFDFEAYAPCGLATQHNIIKKWDDPSVMCDVQRVSADLVWTAFGYYEYKLPVSPLFADKKVTGIDIELEISAHPLVSKHKMVSLPPYMTSERITDGVSDVTFWLNGVELGTQTIEAGLDAEKSVYTPTWWRTQPCHGVWVKVVVNQKGVFLGGRKVSGTTYLDVCRDDPFISFRVGIKEDAAHTSGIMIFGKNFGRYDKQIIVKTFIE
jgi:predicted transcriptional regulator